MRMSGLDTRLIVFVRREDKAPTRHIITGQPYMLEPDNESLTVV